MTQLAGKCAGGQRSSAATDESSASRPAAGSADDALRSSEYRTVFENTGTGTIIIDADTTVALANEEFVRLTGRSKAELEGKMSFAELVVPEDADRMVGYHRQRRIDRTAAPRTYECQVVHRSGQTRVALVTVDVIPGTDRSVASFLDITDRKQMERAARERLAELAHLSRVATVGELSSGLAHELNQPLFAILNYAESCLNELRSDRGSREETQEILTEVIRQATRAGEIVHGMRDLVRRRPTSLRPVSLTHCVHEAVSFMAVAARKAYVSVRCDCGEDDLVVRADEVQMQQVIMNLVLNAIEVFAEAGREDPVVWIRTRRVGESHAWVEVEDNGPGMCSGMAELVFEPFMTTKADGMGMGLSISRTIVEAHGGKIWMTSKPGQGTTVRFSLQLIQEGADDGR